MKENAFTHYTRDNTLYSRLLDAASDDKLPILDNKSFELLNKTYGKDKMRTHLADYIASERPVFPLKEITKDDMRKCFYDLKKFDTDWHKSFVTTAPYIIVVFKKTYDIEADGSKGKNYYVNESVGIACGFLLSAIHQLGLVSLTHTPSPMNFLAELLNRPSNEKAFLLIPIGYAADDAMVPDIERKPIEEVMLKY